MVPLAMDKVGQFLQQISYHVSKLWNIIRNNKKNVIFPPPQQTQSSPQSPTKPSPQPGGSESAPRRVRFPPRKGWQRNPSLSFPWRLDLTAREESTWRAKLLWEAKDWEAVLRYTPSSPSYSPPSRSTKTKGWVYTRRAEFPWRLEKIVQKDDGGNWRKTWIIEVKDVNTMDWESISAVMKGGRGGK